MDSQERLLSSLRAVDAFVATERLSTDALVEAWRNPRTFTLGTDADRVLRGLDRRGVAALQEAAEGRLGALILAWAEANAGDEHALAPIFAIAERALQPPSLLCRAARARVRLGPPDDALAALAFAGRSEWLDEEPAVRARIDLAIWWAGRDARSNRYFASWLLESAETFRALVVQRARGALLDRVLAARALVIAADGYDPRTAVPGVLVPLRGLLRHADPLVWIPSAIALGRFAAHHRDARAWLFRALESTNIGERRRATCALASMPGSSEWWVATRVESLLDHQDDPWTLAAIGPAIPHLSSAHRSLWEQFADRVEATNAAEVLWSATRGLVSAKRLGVLDRRGARLLELARRRAMTAPASPTDALLHHEIRRATDFCDALDPDPTDVEGALDRLVDVALHSDPERVRTRAETLARSIRATFDTALQSDEDDAAPHLATVESCARAAALGLYEPILALSDAPTNPVDRASLLRHLAESAAAVLDVDEPRFALHRTALRVLGLHLDAAPNGETIHFVLRAIERPVWLRSPTKRQASRFKKPLGELVARIVSAAQSPNDEDSYRRFLAWWSFAAASADAVRFVVRAEANAARGLSASARRHAEAIRLAIGDPTSSSAAWRDTVRSALAALKSDDTALAATVNAIADALDAANEARRRRDPTKIRLAVIALGEATAVLTVLLAEPARALARDAELSWTNDDIRDLVAQTIALMDEGAPARDTDELDRRWLEAGGPLLGPALKRSVAACRDALAGAKWGDRTVRRIGPYRLQTLLGGGAQGEVWRVVREPIGRLFVMKLLPARTRTMNEVDRDRMRAALASEGALLKQMYHPNVAHFVDFGWDEEQPYLVLEWLVGCDLSTYHHAAPLTLAELRPIVEDTVNGIIAMHALGLVHGDLKPGNVFLRLPLPADAPVFDSARHRRTLPVLGAVVIDFGVARTLAAAAATDMISGTPGYLAPEQTRGEVHPNTDVYALAATVFRVLTGRSFFEPIDALGARILAHQERAPFADEDTQRVLLDAAPPTLLALLSDATALHPGDRPDIAAFGARFAKIVDEVSSRAT